MEVPVLTVEDCEDVINVEMQLGAVCIPADNINHKITYNPLTMLYTVLVNKEVHETHHDRDKMLALYNKLNAEVL